MKRHIFWLWVFFALLTASHAFAAGEVVVEEQAKEKTANLMPKETNEKWYLSSYYDYGWVEINSKKGSWTVLTNNVAYSVNNRFTAYLEENTLDRFGQKGYTVNVGAYFKFPDYSYLRPEIGFGKDADYTYSSQARVEYGHRLVRNCYWQLGSRYLNYSAGDVFIVSPGLIYYFGNNYVSVFYNTSHTEGRGNAQWGTIRGNFYLNDRLSAWLGTAVGERLFDIELLPASEQYGSIAFGGIDWKLTKDIHLKLGASYSEEKPYFSKSSFEAGLSCKF